MKLGEAFGFRTARVEGAPALKQALQDALAAGGPTLIELPIEFVPYR